MKGTTLPITLLVFITSYGLLVSQEIQVFPYSQNDSLTKCANGLLAGVDTIVFKSILDYSDDPDMNIVYFQTRKTMESTYYHLCHVSVNENCNEDQKDCTCRKPEAHILEITIRIIASVSYSGGSLRGTAIRSSDNLQIRSQEQMFPPIYDLNNANGHLFINGKQHETTRNNCEEYISGPDLNFTFVCLGELSPCLIEISANDSMEDVEGREQATYYRVYNNSQEINVNVKYAACSLEGYHHTVSCKINIARVDNFSCHSEISTDKIKVVCSAVVFSTTNCKFFIENRDIKEMLQNVTETKNTERLSWTQLAHRATCGFNLLKANVKPGLYDVVVVMHPSVDGYDDDIKLGTNTTISIPINSSMKHTNDARSTQVIAYIASGNGLILLLGLVVCYYKLRDSPFTCDSCFTCVEGKIEPGNYDVINQGYLLVDAGMYQGNNEYDTSGYILIESSSPNENTQQIESDQQNIYETIDDDVLTSRVVFLSNIQHVKVDVNKVDTDIDTRNGDTSNSDCNSSSSTSRNFQLGNPDQELAVGTNVDHSDNQPCASSCDTNIDTTDNHPLGTNTNDDITYNDSCGKVDATNNHPCASNVNVECTDNHLCCSNSNVDTTDNHLCCSNSNVDTTENYICGNNSNIDTVGNHLCRSNSNVDTVPNDICGSITNVDIRGYHPCGSSTNDVTTGT